MRLIAITAPAGGVGCTTLTSHTALMLQALGHTCLALELHPRNQLGVHLGLPHPQPHGWVQLAVQGSWWGNAALTADTGLNLMPFGPSTVAEQAELCRLTLDTPQWLRQHIEGLQLPHDTVIVMDVGLPATPLAWQAIAAADAVLCCTTPAQDSIQTLPLLLETLGTHAPAHAWLRLLACRMDARRPSHTLGWSTLRTRWPTLLLEDVIHEDEALAQSWAEGRTVQLHAPHSLSSHDLQGVAHTLHSWLASPPVAQP